MANALAQAFWPALIIALAMAVVWRFVVPGRLRTGLQIIASLLFFVPQAIIIFLLYQSMVLLLYQEALLSLWMLGTASLLVSQLWRQWSRKPEGTPPPQRLSHWRKTEKEIAMETAVYQRLQARRGRRSPAVVLVAAAVMGGFGLYLARTFIADAFYPRIIVDGRVEGFRLNRGGRAPRLSDIVINGQMFHCTRDLQTLLRPGDHIRAEIGAGSHAILRWKQVTGSGR